MDGRAYKMTSLPSGLSLHNKISFRWKDQGWGNQKGKLHIVLKGGKAPADYKAPSEYVIATTTGVAAHELELKNLRFDLRHDAPSSV